MTDPKILAIPVTLREAERLAREFAAVSRFFNPDPNAFALLLSDLTRPESRDAWVRALETEDAMRIKQEILAGAETVQAQSFDHLRSHGYRDALRACILATFGAKS